jgi:hypothetical protein
MDSIKKDIPIWKRPEAWQSPVAVFLVIGYGLFIIVYVILWILKWALFSWIRPFSNSKLFCKIGFHKYREMGYSNKKCLICNKDKKENFWKD